MTEFLVGYSIASTLVAVISTCSGIAATLALREYLRTNKRGKR